MKKNTYNFQAYKDKSKKKIKKRKPSEFRVKKKRKLLDVTSDSYLIDREDPEERKKRIKNKPPIDIEKSKQETIEKYARVDLSKYEHLFKQR